MSKDESERLTEKFIGLSREELEHIAGSDSLLIHPEAIEAARQELERREREEKVKVEALQLQKSRRLFKAMGHDGYEYRALDVDGVRTLYREGRLSDSSLVFDTEAGQWVTLSLQFDTGSWKEEHQQVESSVESRSGTSEKRTTGTTETQSDTRSPLFSSYGEAPPLEAEGPVLTIAGGLLLISAIVGLFIQAADPSQQGTGTNVGVIMDVACGVGLLRKNGWMGQSREKWRLWSIVRALLGAFVFGLVMPLSERQGHPLWWISSMLVLLLCTGEVMLLFDPPARRWRAWAGTFMASFALLLAIVIPLAGNPLLSYANRAQMEGKILEGREFSDSEQRFRIDLPDDWVMVRKDTVYFPVPNASVVMFHPATGTFVALVSESIIPSSLGATPLQKYMDMVLQNRQKADSSVQEIRREASKLDGRDALENLIEWSFEGQSYTGFQRASYDGSRFYLFTSAAARQKRAETEVAFHNLLSKFVITRSADDEDRETASKISSEYRLVSPETLFMLLKRMEQMGLNSNEVGKLTRELMQEGPELLPAGEREELRAAVRGAIERLPRAEKTRFYSYYEKNLRGESFSQYETDDLAALSKQAYATIPDKLLPRVQFLYDKAIRAALEKRERTKSKP